MRVEWILDGLDDAPAERRELPARWYARGVALVFDTPFAPQSKPHERLPTLELPATIRVAPTALDASLERIHAGAAPFALLVNHEMASVLCTAADGLEVWREGAELRFAVKPMTTQGYYALDFLQKNPAYRFASVAFDPVAADADLVTEAVLIEVSLVLHAACPGTSAAVVRGNW